MQAGSALGALPVLHGGKGTVGFQLKATASVHEEVLDVQVSCCSASFAHPQCTSAKV